MTVAYHNTVTWKSGAARETLDAFDTYDKAATAARKTLDENPFAISVTIAKHTTTIERIGTFLK